MLIFCRLLIHAKPKPLNPVHKSERLFQLLTILRGRRTVITAKTLAELLEVSERTIYRDIQALLLQGVPIEGEAGLGYMLRPGCDIPPLMFDREELAALQLGIDMVKAWSDKALGVAAERARQKIESVLPDNLKQPNQTTPLLVPNYYSETPAAGFASQLRQAIDNKHKVALDYTRADGEQSRRTVWPLGLTFWGQKWTLLSWCELRQAYREFRLDRINTLIESSDIFIPTEQISLEHYLQLIDQMLAEKGESCLFNDNHKA